MQAILETVSTMAVPRAVPAESVGAGAPAHQGPPSRNKGQPTGDETHGAGAG